MTNKRRYPIGHMDMLGEVFTPSKYVLMALEENNHEFIRIPKLFYPKKTYYEVGCKIERSYKGYYLVPHKDVDIYYILFVLNSPFSNYFLTSDKKVSYYSVNLNLLSQYPMPIVDKTHQIACAYLEKIIYEMHRVLEKQDNGDRYIDLRLKSFEELRLALTSEMFGHHIIDGYDLNLLEDWKGLVDSYDGIDKEKPTINIILEISNKLLMTNNEIISDLKKFRLIAKDYFQR